jgi:hypothetical protein
VRGSAFLWLAPVVVHRDVRFVCEALRTKLRLLPDAALSVCQDAPGDAPDQVVPVPRAVHFLPKSVSGGGRETEYLDW